MTQSVVMRHILGTTRIFIPEFPSFSVFRYVSKKNSGRNPSKTKIVKGKELNHTTVILQDGLDIQEVPTIVRKMKNVDIARDPTKMPDIKQSVELHDAQQVASSEEEEILNGLSRCHTLKALTDLLDIIPLSEFTSFVAIHGMRRIIELENNTYYRNTSPPDEDVDPRRIKRLNKLMSLIIVDHHCIHLLECLDILSRDNIGASNASYKRKLINEVLIQSNDVKFSVVEMCKIVKLMSGFNCDNREKYIDELWAGFIDRDKDIHENNIAEIFQILPFLKDSRKMVYNMLERKFESIWWKIPINAIVDIMKILGSIQPYPHLFTLLSRNVSTNIHSISEDELIEILNGFSVNNYLDENIERLLEKYVKAKGQKLKNISVVCSIVEYCVKSRLRLEGVLQGCTNYLIRNFTLCSPVHFKSLFIPLGYFNYHPNNGVKLWQIVDDFVEKKFIQFRPEDIVEIVMTCIYLEKFPFNVTKKILNPYFLDRMHTCRSGNELQQLRTNLKIFDSAMTLECPQYPGPFLPRDYAAKSIMQDGRVKRLISNIYEVFVEIVGSFERISTSVLIPQLPANSLYLVDVLLHPTGMTPTINNLNIARDRNLYSAVLIHPPEHYCSKGTHLLGPQVMKKRHLKSLGIGVVGLKLTDVLRVKSNKKDLRSFLIRKLEEVEYIL